MSSFRPFLAPLAFLTLFQAAVAQQLAPKEAVTASSPIFGLPLTSLRFTVPGCDRSAADPDKPLTFRERSCFYGNKLVSPGMAFHAAFSSAFSQWQNNPYVLHQNWDDYGRRFGVFYAKTTARDIGELMAGYFNHEDPRPHRSNQTGFWNRTRSALLSVVVTEDSTGDTRPSLVPIAGAFGSGMIGVACYRTHNSVEDGFARTGKAYAGYFAAALFREFKPDLMVVANRFLKKNN